MIMDVGPTSKCRNKMSKVGVHTAVTNELTRSQGERQTYWCRKDLVIVIANQG